MKLPTRHIVIQVRLTRDERTLIRKAAKEKRLTVSAYVRETALAFNRSTHDPRVR